MIARLEGVGYRYPGAAEDALREVEVELAEGAFTLVAGPSAGGKSTLLRLFNGLVPQFHGGSLSGSVMVAGRDPSRTPAREMARVVGMVFQEPEAQAVAETVEDEVAFGMEQQGVPRAEMRQRVASLLAALGVEHLAGRQVATLSGGERQRVAIAAVLALSPRMLLMDEPTSQLDSVGAQGVIDTVRALHTRGDLTVLAAEHRLERLLPVVDVVLGVEAGRVTAMTPGEAAARLRAVPPVCEVGRRLGLEPVPLSVKSLREAVLGRQLNLKGCLEAKSAGDELLRVEGVSVSYGETVALQGASFEVGEGEVVALMGANGSGKTTLFRAIAGLAKGASGRVLLKGEAAPEAVQARTVFVGLVPQDPAIALYHDRVRDELAETLRNRRATGSLDEALSAWNVAELSERHPGDVSVGQQQRVAIGAMLAHEPRVWLLDEPTRGADGKAKLWLARRLREHAERGGAAVVATHDVESAARFATRVIGLEHGRIAFDLPVRKAFGSDGPLPTQAARILAGAMLPEEVVA